MEKSISPLFSGPRGDVDANDWCIKKSKFLRFEFLKFMILETHDFGNPYNCSTR